MDPIKERLRKTGNYNLFQDTKQDTATLMRYCNMLADKINELNLELQHYKQSQAENNQS